VIASSSVIPLICDVVVADEETNEKYCIFKHNLAVMNIFINGSVCML